MNSRWDGGMGKEACVGSVSTSFLHSCKRTRGKKKRKNRSPGQKAGFFMSIINTASHYEILNRHTVLGTVTLFFEY